jgi:hypothetical protein
MNTIDVSNSTNDGALLQAVKGKKKKKKKLTAKEKALVRLFNISNY